ncbi:DUF1850 domain-containing protein [Azospirillum sp. ST 5-10]|uniref:DUF1850 domain-containing protein n=1 Tax=unclassified Azospirillum TaxID=2630922 RepID=UPI003F4A1D38
MTGTAAVMAAAGAALLTAASAPAFAGPVPAAAACRPTLVIRDARAGDELARVALDPAAPAFATAYRHSVMKETVTDDYRVVDGRIVLVRERFAGSGYGLAQGPEGPGERLVTGPDGTRVLTLARPIDRLVIRASAAAGNRITAPEAVDLARWGDGPRELAVDACADHDPATADTPDTSRQGTTTP